MNDKPFTNHAFHEYLAEHQLMGSRCRGCGGLHVPPRPFCPTCHGEEMEWVPMSGNGTLAAFTTVNIGLTAMIDAGYDRENPYCAGIVRLAEGPAVSAQILGVDVAHPERITIGTPLQVAFVERGEGEERRTYLAFAA